MTEYRNLPPSGIGEASKYNFSPWYIKIRFDEQKPMEGRNWNEANTPVSTLQTTVGNEYEEKVYDELEELVYETKDSWYDWDESEKNERKLIDSISEVSDRNPSRPTALEQARLEGKVGVFNLSGDADLILLYPSEDEDVHIQVIDIKSSWEEKPSQQLQSATYSLLVRKILSKYDVDFDYTIGAGIFYRESDIGDLLTKQDTPSFDARTREGDVRRVLREDGPFVRAFNESFEDLPLTINENSPYAEVSVVEALESSDLCLLGISPGEKQKFLSEGIRAIEDMARLYEKVEDSKPYEYEEPEINDNYEQEVQNLKQNYRLSERLYLLSQKAQSVLGVINPNSEYAHDKPWSPWIIGSGSGELPEDNPPYDAELPMRKGGMVRVYLNVQYDHVRNSLVAVSGRVTAGVYDSEPLTFSRVVDDFNRNSDTWQGENERQLLKDVATDLFNAIKLLSQISNLGSRIVPHIYLYSQTEYDMLYEGVQRHRNEEDEIDMLRYILDKREGIDQKMVSVVENDISSRLALDDFDTSVHSMVDNMYPNDEVEFENEDWEMQVDGGERVDLSEAFKFQMFDNFVPIQNSSNGLKVMNEYDKDGDPDGFYRTAPRNGSQIPIEYLWACEDVGILDEGWAEKSRQKGIIRRFMWVDASEKKRRITSSMYESMTRCLAKCLHHIERGISYRSTDIEKKKISIEEVAKECQEDSDLSTACKQFLDFESKAAEEEAFDVYSEPLERRIIEGKSLPVRITDISREEPYMFEVKGQMIYDEFDFQNPRRIASSSEISGSDGTSGGSRCVATPIVETGNGYKVAVDNPRQIAGSTKVTVDEFDPSTGEVKIRGYRQSNKSEYEYVRFREPWTLDPSEPRKQYVGPGETFVLDPNPDSKMADKSLKSLRHTENNPVYQDITQMKNSGFKSDSSIFSSSKAEEYVEWSKEAVKFVPNSKQQDFIKETSKYSLLQGPPGTGKTSGALAHAVMARAYDMEKEDSRLTGLVTGLSNKSVDEVLDDVAELKQTYDDEFSEHPLSNVRLIRLSYDNPDNTSECVEYRNYQVDEDKEILRDVFEDYGDGSQQQQLSSVKSSNEHTIIFSTPGRIESLAGKMEDDMSSEEVYSRSDDLFDFIAVDEASMMPLYQLFLTGHFCSSRSQLMLAGDHRQLPPVRQHDWSDENRKSIIDNLPHLSVLDYFRYLRGDDVDEVYDESPESPKLDIPIVRLEKTYRCHKDVTEFLKTTVYSRDGIEYTSTEDDLIPQIKSDTDVVNGILDNTEPMTVVIHNDRNSQQVNIPESDAISRIIDEIPESESVGVVTPHNAQKGRLRTMCPRGLIDTVERFQGGEKDVMILSTTVSDPAHLSDEEDFILSLNRLNVALSRMKKKLIVVVPQSVFELVPDETETYDESTVWKSMYSQVKADESPEHTGRISDIRQESSRGEVELDVYHLK